tara:strand:+ start:1426 stop:1650 length:225 start_codon:yes stop_codon:yes gene_type:complete
MPTNTPPDIPAPLAPGDLLDENQAAVSLSIAVQTLRNWRWKGIGPRFRKIGARTVRYHRADLAAFIERQNDKAA